MSWAEWSTMSCCTVSKGCNAADSDGATNCKTNTAISSIKPKPRMRIPLVF